MPPLDELFDDDGLMIPGPEVVGDHGGVISLPWQVSLLEVRAVMGTGERREFMDHVEGMWRWWHHSHKRDRNAELWVTGEFGCSLGPVEDLSFTVVHDPALISAGDLWILQRLATMSTIPLRAGSASVDVVRHNAAVGDAYDRSIACRRAASTVHNPATGDAYRTGWISIVKEEP